MIDLRIKTILEKLSHSKFRSSFHLKDNNLEYIKSRGIETIEEHAKDFIRKRLAPSLIQNDGKQTPTKGHPVFIAQHATATCCRGCLSKWHHIPKNVELTEFQQEYIIKVIMTWIKQDIEKSDFN